MDYNIKDLYENTMSSLMSDYEKRTKTTGVYSDLYNVYIERTPNFTVLWDGLELMTMLAVYDWNTHSALDLSADVDDFVNGEIKFIIENFFWFADKVFFVPKEVMSCRE